MSDNKGPAALATVLTVTCVAAAVVLTRLWIRLSIVRASGWDDWIITGACASIAGLCVCVSQQVKWGLGRHMDELDQTMLDNLFFYFWLSILFYNVALGLTKSSILMQYLRIFATHKTMRIAIFATLAFIILYTVEAVLVSVFTCTPVPRFWNRTLAGTCVNTKALWFAHAAINIFSDILIIILPMPAFNRLNIPKKQKIALMAIFALGTFGCVTSMLRLQALYSVSDSVDMSYDNVNAALWSTIEVNVAIICASLPTFKGLIKRLFPHLLSTDPASRSPHNAYGTSGSRWRASSYRNVTKQHGTLISLDGLERGDGGGSGGAKAKSKDVRVFTTTIEKGRPDDGSSRDGAASSSGESDGGGREGAGAGIKVTTVVSQREDAGSDRNLSYGDEVHSISESERKFFPHA